MATKTAVKTFTVPAGTQVRTTDRKGTDVTVATDKDTVIPYNKATLSLSPNSGRVLVSFQYKGRRATAKLSKGLETH